MHIIDLKQATSNYVNEHDLDGSDWNPSQVVDRTLGNAIMELYPSPYYAITGASDASITGVDADQLCEEMWRHLITSMYNWVFFLVAGLRNYEPTYTGAAILLLDSDIQGVTQIRPDEHKRVMVICYDGVAFVSEVTTEESINAFFDEIVADTGIPWEN